LRRRRRRSFGICRPVPAAGQRREEYQTAFKAQEKIDLERSFEYAKKTLRRGMRPDG
jgi:hypothetical protein